MICSDIANTCKFFPRNGVNTICSGEELTQFAIAVGVGYEKVDVRGFSVLMSTKHDRRAAAEIAPMVREKIRVETLKNRRDVLMMLAPKQEGCLYLRYGPSGR